MKILIVPFNLLSHVGRCLTIAKSLKEQFQVTFLISKEYISFVAEHGFYYRIIHNQDNDILNKVKLSDFSWINKQNILSNFKYLTSAIKEINPDLVISDSNIFTSISCEYLGVPHISLVNTYMTRYFAERHTDISYLNIKPKLFISLLYKLIPEPKRSEIFKRGEDIYLRNFHAPFRFIRNQYTLSEKHHLFDEFEGDEVFLLDPEEIFPIVKNKKTKVIGPIYYNLNDVKTEKVKFYKNKPNILITLGSSGDIKNFLFLEKINLTKTYNVILLGESSFSLRIDGAQRIKFANIRQIADYIDVVICHGGNGTVYSFLSKGVASITIPSHIEQYWFSYQIHKKGLGVLYNPQNKTRINEIIENLIDIRRKGLLNDISKLFDVERSVESFKSYLFNFIKNKNMG